jgi:hypothetical protein
MQFTPLHHILVRYILLISFNRRLGPLIDLSSAYYGTVASAGLGGRIVGFQVFSHSSMSEEHLMGPSVSVCLSDFS